MTTCSNSQTRGPSAGIPGYGYQQFPLYAGRSDTGTSYLLVLHVSLGEGPSVITTVTQRRDDAVTGAARLVDGPQLLVQSTGRFSDMRGTGVGQWQLSAAEQRGTVLVHPDSDSASYHSEPVRPD